MATSKYEVVDNREDRVIQVTVGDTAIRFSVEPAERRLNQEKSNRGDRLRLALGRDGRQASPTRAWEDHNHRRIESDLSDFVVASIVLAEEQYRAGLVLHRAHLIERRARAAEEIAAEKLELERREKETRELEERSRIAQLVAQATALGRAETIRDYVRRVQERSPNVGVSEELLSRWAVWALGEADRIDPTTNGTILGAAQGLKREH